MKLAIRSSKTEKSSVLMQGYSIFWLMCILLSRRNADGTCSHQHFTQAAAFVKNSCPSVQRTRLKICSSTAIFRKLNLIIIFLNSGHLLLHTYWDQQTLNGLQKEYKSHAAISCWKILCPILRRAQHQDWNASFNNLSFQGFFQVVWIANYMDIQWIWVSDDV